MAENIEHLRYKALSIGNAIAKMSAAERKVMVTGELAADYNKLRAMTLEARPELENVLPPKIPIVDVVGTGAVKTQTASAHVDLAAYCGTIGRLLQSKQD